MFTEKDLAQIASHGLLLDQVENQLNNFRNGFPYLSINRAAVPDDGIMICDKSQIDSYINLFNKESQALRIVKFVPASGAATRMFKELFEFVNDGKQSKSVDTLVENINSFAFYDELKDVIGEQTDPRVIVAAIILDGLGYGTQPKALIKFHNYVEGARTAAEEHLVEGALYSASAGEVNIHFTVSAEHRDGFDKLFALTLPVYEKKYGIKYNISFSQQKPSTDTIAVSPDNAPFREDDGSLLFRPAGHGALLSNLNDIDADLIYIKTVDNVAPDRLKKDTVDYKKCLAGIALSVQCEVFALIDIIDGGVKDADFIKITKEYIENRLYYRLPATFAGLSADEQCEALRAILDRPLRVCGMVRNEGEPGGGPFWVNDADGAATLQIAESSQIAPEQIALMKEATHFNPVDLVCAVKNNKRKKFDLTQYFDPSTGFISNKSKNGRDLKAQELPGLWNGAMARWNTIFVEVPISTFSPVKVVNDLLRDQHR